MKKLVLGFMLLAGLVDSTNIYAATTCTQTTVKTPQPFLGNAGETVVLSNGSIYTVGVGQFNNLFAFSPAVNICSDGTLLTDKKTIPVTYVGESSSTPAPTVLPVATNTEQLLYPQQKTSLSDTAKFEIIQNPLKAVFTFKLNKFTGDVTQLGVAANGSFTWNPIVVQNFTKIAKQTKPRFQLFMSGILLTNQLFMDSETGQTWSLFQDNNGILSFTPAN